MRPRPVLTIPSVAAAFCAMGSFATNPGWGFALAILAIVLGAIGILLSIIPGKRGGIVSLISMVVGVFGMIAAIFKLAF